ncbi:MAG: Acb2/Tad1 domain-containing protein [Thiobacillus sp.]
MENQHRKIAGYRELSKAEVDLMNRIEAKGAEMLTLQSELVTLLKQNELARVNAVDQAETSDQAAIEQFELDRFKLAEPFRWASIGKTDIQTGVMAMVRAVAQPAGV